MIVATAGHVDHGKTSLVRQLTGVDTDRLPEEKKRGLSIDLGFAYLTDPHDATRNIGFVDVPGHERFLKNMIAGVGSISLALLVVAADDGLMPQSIEHVAVLKLMGQSRIVPVITKTDLVANQRVKEVSMAVREYLGGQGFAIGEVFNVSVHDQWAIDQLRSYLIEQSGHNKKTDADGRQFRMAVDRSFSVSGAGTIITGTVLSGEVRHDDSIYLPGYSASVRVRSLRAQSVEATVARAGQRCALNLTGSALRRRLPVRGDYLTSNTRLVASALIDVDLTVVDSTWSNTHRERKVFKHWTPCHLHIGTASTTCRVALLEVDMLSTGGNGLARIYCDKPIVAVSGDKFVLRDQSARITIAGGTVIDPQAPSGGRSSPRRIAVLSAMNHRDPAVAFTSLSAISSTGVDIQGFIARYNCSEEKVAVYTERTEMRCDPGLWAIDEKHWMSLRDKVMASLEHWHASQPLLLGASSEQISRRIKPAMMTSLATAMLAELVADNSVVKKGAVYRLSSWSTTLDDQHETLWSAIQALMITAGQTAPRVVEIAEALEMSVKEVVQLANTFVAHGRLYRVSDNRYYLPSQLFELAVLCESLAERDQLTVANFRDQSGIGRNLVVELLEFFDRCQFTRRSGASRRVLRSATLVFE